MDSAASVSSKREAGFSLIEVVFSIFLLSAVAIGIAQLFAIGTMANWRAKVQTSTSVLAAQKMEQLRALTWAFDAEGLPVSDVVTRLDTPEPSTGGQGLNPSPADALAQDQAGYVDYLDVHGAYVGTDPTPGAAFCRRWAIRPLPTNPNNTLVFQVRVIPIVQQPAADATGRRALQEALIFTVKTRKAP